MAKALVLSLATVGFWALGVAALWLTAEGDRSLTHAEIYLMAGVSVTSVVLLSASWLVGG